jgi:hypothetical protein
VLVKLHKVHRYSYVAHNNQRVVGSLFSNNNIIYNHSGEIEPHALQVRHSRV